jgi:hypothetical protein
MQQAIPIASKAPEAGPFLIALMERLETDKVKLMQQGHALDDSKYATVCRLI